MPLPSSGQISFNDVRTEFSQSALTDYTFSQWFKGYNNQLPFSTLPWTTSPVYAPVNILSSGSRFSKTNLFSALNQGTTMSAWYGYTHTASISTATTASLYLHADASYYCYASSMLLVNIGASDTSYIIKVSGSDANIGRIEVYYGKPWKNDGSTGTSSLSDFVTGSNVTLGNLNFSYNYNFSYDPNKGPYLYIIAFGNCL